MEVYPLWSLVCGCAIFAIPGSLLNGPWVVFSFEEPGLGQFSERVVPFLPHSCPQRSFGRAILPDDRRELESGTSPPPGCEGDLHLPSCQYCAAYLEKCREKSPGTCQP